VFENSHCKIWILVDKIKYGLAVVFGDVFGLTHSGVDSFLRVLILGSIRLFGFDVIFFGFFNRFSFCMFLFGLGLDGGSLFAFFFLRGIFIQYLVVILTVFFLVLGGG
jgi:hypothetical protein